MDESVAPSNTPQCNAVYDGCNYYYLPWSSEKPCVCVESYWENIAFRLEPLNALLRIIDRVVRLACNWFKNVLFFTNSLAKLSSDSLLLDSLLVDSLLSDSLISQSHSKM